MSAWTMTASKGNGGGGSEKAPAGNHLAALVGIFDMGTQLDDFDPQKEKWQRRAFFVWELLGVKVTGQDRNHVIGIDLTLSMNEKAKLRKWVEARTGKPIPDGTPFDPTSELGQPCMLNVIMKGDYPKVDGVAGVPAAFLASCPKPGYKPVAISLDEFKEGATIPDWCPWLYGSELSEHIKACREIGGSKPRPKKHDGPAPATATTGDKIPF